MSANSSDLKTEDFDRLYAGKLEPVLRSLEGQRRRALLFLILLIGAGLAFYWFMITKKEWPTYPFPDHRLVEADNEAYMRALIATGLIALVAGVLSYTQFRAYKKKFKSSVVKPLVEGLFSGLSYEAELGISRESYLASQLFSRSPESYDCEDYCQCQVGNTRLEFSEVHSQYSTTSTDSKGNTSTSWHTIFKGIFFIAEFNKNITARTFVLPDMAESGLGKWMGGIFQKANASLESRGQLVKMEDPTFEDYFVVYSDDQVEARYILNPAMMQRMVKFSQGFDCMPHFSFMGANLNVAIPFKKDLFEPRFWRSGVNRDDCLLFVNSIQSFINVVKELDLNTRIWSKA